MLTNYFLHASATYKVILKHTKHAKVQIIDVFWCSGSRYSTAFHFRAYLQSKGGAVSSSHQVSKVQFKLQVVAAGKKDGSGRQKYKYCKTFVNRKTANSIYFDYQPNMEYRCAKQDWRQIWQRNMTWIMLKGISIFMYSNCTLLQGLYKVLFPANQQLKKCSRLTATQEGIIMFHWLRFLTCFHSVISGKTAESGWGRRGCRWIGSEKILSSVQEFSTFGMSIRCQIDRDWKIKGMKNIEN